MNNRLPLLVLAVSFCAVPHVSAHSGRTDANGGHFNRKTGEYHYHGGGGGSSAPSVRESARTEPRTVYRTVARTEEPTRPAGPTAAQLRQAKLTEAREYLAAARRLLREVADESDGGDRQLALQLLEFHRLDEEAATDRVDETERAAQNKLTVARAALSQNRRDVANRLLSEIIEDYPDTKAGVEARELRGQ